MADDPAVRPGVESEVVAQSPEMRFTLYTLAPGAQIPWHFHSEVVDWYVCREGVFTVESQSPETSVMLAVGEIHEMPVRRVHRVVNTGDGTCRFALVQGLGKYDFNSVDE
jgi:quercetin dioxygenase-like cupin family protein